MLILFQVHRTGGVNPFSETMNLVKKTYGQGIEHPAPAIEIDTVKAQQLLQHPDIQTPEMIEVRQLLSTIIDPSHIEDLSLNTARVLHPRITDDGQLSTEEIRTGIQASASLNEFDRRLKVITGLAGKIESCLQGVEGQQQHVSDSLQVIQNYQNHLRTTPVSTQEIQQTVAQQEQELLKIKLTLETAQKLQEEADQTNETMLQKEAQYEHYTTENGKRNSVYLKTVAIVQKAQDTHTNLTNTISLLSQECGQAERMIEESRNMTPAQSTETLHNTEDTGTSWGQTALAGAAILAAAGATYMLIRSGKGASIKNMCTLAKQRAGRSMSQLGHNMISGGKRALSVGKQELEYLGMAGDKVVKVVRKEAALLGIVAENTIRGGKLAAKDFAVAAKDQAHYWGGVVKLEGKMAREGIEIAKIRGGVIAGNVRAKAQRVYHDAVNRVKLIGAPRADGIGKRYMAPHSVSPDIAPSPPRQVQTYSVLSDGRVTTLNAPSQINRNNPANQALEKIWEAP